MPDNLVSSLFIHSKLNSTVITIAELAKIHGKKELKIRK